MKRNLYFYLYPIKGTCWPWHLVKLRAYWNVFNGRKLIVIARDGRTEASERVLPWLGATDYQVMQVDNDPGLGETRSFLDGLARLQSSDPQEATFYAHAKGVTRPAHLLPNILAWCDAMYLLNLSSPELVDRLMERFDTVGAFHLAPPGAPWIFGGTFFWFKHSALFSGRWTEIERTRHGVENYVGTHIPISRACPLAPLGEYEDLYRVRVPLGRCRAWMRGWLSRELGAAAL
jgi:hypothetical protein